MMISVQTLHNDIVGLLYDIKELLTTYRGNLIALCVGIAVAVLITIDLMQVCFSHF